MADYTGVSDDAVAPNAPVTSDLLFALRDDPIAIAEGAAGAPRIVRGAISTATASASVLVPATGEASIALNQCSFFPSAQTSGPVSAYIGGGGFSADGGTVLFKNISPSPVTVNAAWRYIAP